MGSQEQHSTSCGRGPMRYQYVWQKRDIAVLARLLGAAVSLLHGQHISLHGSGRLFSSGEVLLKLEYSRMNSCKIGLDVVLMYLCSIVTLANSRHILLDQQSLKTDNRSHTIVPVCPRYSNPPPGAAIYPSMLPSPPPTSLPCCKMCAPC
ncbi:hypothetical protein AB1N83_009183 [Pleurotus pulmonarius]